MIFFMSIAIKGRGDTKKIHSFVGNPLTLVGHAQNYGHVVGLGLR